MPTEVKDLIPLPSPALTPMQFAALANVPPELE
jgi:hypothetical protein